MTFFIALFLIAVVEIIIVYLLANASKCSAPEPVASEEPAAAAPPEEAAPEPSEERKEEI